MLYRVFSWQHTLLHSEIPPGTPITSWLHETPDTMTQIVWSASSATKTYSFGVTSRRTPWYTALMDPYQPGRYYRSVIGALGFTAKTWRTG